MRARVLARPWVVLVVASLGCSRRGERGAVMTDAGAGAPPTEQSVPGDRFEMPQLAKAGERPPRVVGSAADVTCSMGEIPAGGYCRITSSPPRETTALGRADALPEAYVEKSIVDAEGRTVLARRSGRSGEQVFPVWERRELFDSEGRRTGRVETVYACRGVPTGVRRTTWRYEGGHVVFRSVEDEDATLEPCDLEAPSAPRVHRFEKVVSVASYGYDASGRLTTIQRAIDPVADTTVDADAAPSPQVPGPDPDPGARLRGRELVTLRRDDEGRVALEVHARTFPGRAAAPPKDTHACSYGADGRLERIATWQTTLAGERESVSELVDWSTRVRRAYTRSRGSPVSTHVTQYARLTPSPVVTTAVADDEDYQGCRFESLVQRDAPDPILLLRPPSPYQSLLTIPVSVTLEIHSPADEPDQMLNKLACTSRDGVATCTHVDAHGRTSTWKATRRAGGRELTGVELRTGATNERRTAVFSYEGGRIARVALEETRVGRPPQAVLFTYRYDGDRLTAITGSVEGRPYSLETYQYAAASTGP